ncbi:hypothetical protein DSCO28_11810 [Desulfosarcina ovata subsp. sediminis]|uniref:DUF4124 domain-containing protein n=1 Tax=Desulfosarcina ovata subsp. sediminis TaxID=885957 RepID=A0A5K7ZK44_9BACT|nr:DUF4124 domain-containing protein [Desulfosarcina ovata]BBO80615.1 hypothetical protein DSCO28_11810 [Desulfosarcina ovata subsp. sediminis]
MQKQMTLGLVIFILLITLPVSAEIYKYTDEYGQKRWTDDLSLVPESQRATAETIESTQTEPDSAESQTPENKPVNAAFTSDTEKTMDTTEISRDALEKEKAELDSFYQQLIEERKTIEKTNNETLDAAERTDLNKRIEDFNNKTERYEAQLNRFNQKINAYNQKIITKQQSTPSESAQGEN